MKTFQPLVTCIIPVYNAEKYLDQGVRSLLAQTYDNVEIILVDDRSTDNSWEISQSYAAEHSNVLAIQSDKNSGGPLRGREKGIKEAHGEWITFMDCDDYVEPTYIENLVKATHDGTYDIAVTGHARLYVGSKKEDFVWENYSQTTEQRLATFYNHFLTHDFWTDPTDTSGQNLIRAEICKKTDLSKYPSRVYAEDTLMALAFLANSKNGVNFVDNHDFVWRQVEGSGSHGGFSEKADQSGFFKACLDIFHSSNVYEKVSRNSPLVSIVIPVHNVEKYLAECLDSVIRQSYKNLEIIVVNDGATDASQTVIDEYKKKDVRIITLKQKNQGLNMARATGTKAATGDYVAYVDSDDIIHQDYVRVMYENLLENDVDISISGLRNFVKKAEISTFEEPILIKSEQVIKDKRGALSYYLTETQSVSNVHQMTAWGKLYKATIVKSTDWHFSNYRRHEDNLEALQWYSLATNGISVCSAQLYYYRKNPNSITQVLQPNINPEGKKLNYFEFIYEIYEKTKAFIHDESFDLAILNNFANTNRSQVKNFFLNGQLDDESLESATNNWDRILGLYNDRIQQTNQKYTQQEKALDDAHNSLSWRVTKPLRTARKLAKKVIRK